MARPSFFRRGRSPAQSRLRLSRRSWLPIVLLLASLAVAATAVAHAHQSVRSHHATVEGLLHDYAAFAAWNYRERATQVFRSGFRQTLGPVATLSSNGIVADPERILERNLGCACAAAPPVAFIFRLDPDGALHIAGDSVPPGTEPLLRRAASARPSDLDGPVLISALNLEANRYFVVAAVGDETHRYTYGFEFEPERYHELLAGEVEADPLLPRSLLNERRNEDILAVRLLSPDGHMLFSSDAEVTWELSSTDTLSAEFGALVVEATVRPDAAGSLVIGGLPRSRVPQLIGIFLLSTLLAGVAVSQLRREGQLARLRSDFVASASHEFRTPLSQMQLFLETLRLGRYSGPAQQRWILDTMERETKRLTNLVNNILCFSGSGDRGNRSDLEVVDLGPYLETVVADFRPLAQGRRAEIDLQLEAPLHARLAPESFRQVLLNLLDNAVKYGPADQTVTLTARRSNDDWVRIAVEDEGPGVGTEERAAIWERFHRGQAAAASATGGTGIGLSIVRDISAAHGGRCRVERAPGGGARFVVEIPFAYEAIRPTAVGAAPVERPFTHVA